MINNIYSSFFTLKTYCEAQNFAGWDPYDGLNSKIFQFTPLKHWDLARLAWIQGFKRSPVNFRKLLMVPKEHNAKGIGLFLNGYCNLYQLNNNEIRELGSKEELIAIIHKLSRLLLTMSNDDYSGACWGYNFDWQARQILYFPKNTPTVVATTFCASALFYAYDITREQTYLETALSSAKFIINDLHRTKVEGGFLLSYSPLKGNDTVYNASMLGGKLLSLCYKYTREETYKETAKTIMQAACKGQQEDGSWVYGLLPVQSWIDSFHTGYNLDALQCYQNHCKDDQFQENLDKGSEYYISNFFFSDGKPKYYHNKTYPIDIHCPAQLWVTLHSLDKWDSNKSIAEKVMQWTLENMQDPKGYFYYQLKKGFSSKISYMRWSNAFMFNAMSYYLLHIDES